MGKTRFADYAAGMRLTNQAYLPAAGAADVTKSTPVFTAPDNCKVLQVQIVTQAAITGANTNSMNLNLINKGAAGIGATELGHIDFVSGTNSVAFDGKDLVADTAIASATELTAGDVLAVEREKVGSGLAMPEVLVIVTFTLI